MVAIAGNREIREMRSVGMGEARNGEKKNGCSKKKCPVKNTVFLIVASMPSLRE